VTVGGTRHVLEPPFFVLATQNPIEQEGTYPLPEAQQDRFMFKVFVDYPSYDEEYMIAERTTGAAPPDIQEVLHREEILTLQDVVRRVPVAPSVIHYTLDLVRLTRPLDEAERRAAGPGGNGSPGRPAAAPQGRAPIELMNRLVTFGAGPRAVQFLLLGGKARAVMHGRKYVSVDDVRALAHAVLRHRIITNYAAEAEGFTADAIVDHLLEQLPPRPLDDAAHAGLQKVLGS
jgi:MoxR-like ATPase